MPATPATLPIPLGAVYDADDVITRLGLARFTEGDEPHARELALVEIEDIDALVPMGSITRRFASASMQALLAEGDGWRATVRRFTSGDAIVLVTAIDEERVDKVTTAIRSAAPPPSPQDDCLRVQFWFRAGQPTYRNRRIATPRWHQIRDNYAAAVRHSLDALMEHEATESNGRLLLWFGPPGTGKTTATRALLQAWAPWCRAAFITDPERLFGDPGYLMTLLMWEPDDHESSPDGPGDPGLEPWRLLVIEDADELLRRDAKAESGQALSRLLNVADGFIGQGLRVLVLLSTNEPLQGIHPAVARPGRCLGQLHFDRLDRSEAAAWLGHEPPAGISFSLAELFELRSGTTPVAPPSTPPPGQYL